MPVAQTTRPVHFFRENQWLAPCERSATRARGKGVPRMGAHALQPTATGKALYGASSPVLEGFLVVVIVRDVFGLDSKFEAYQTG